MELPADKVLHIKNPNITEDTQRGLSALQPGTSTLVKVPFDINHWQNVADKAGPLPEPNSNDPTQGLFDGHPVGATNPLHVAVARLLGYRWPKQKS